MRKILDVQYSEHEDCKLDMYLPDGDGFPLLVYFHGGGLVAGDKLFPAVNLIANHLVSHRIGLACANYRMYPRYEYPDFLFDAARAVKFIKDESKKIGAEEIFLGGSSAGAYISMMLCFDERYLKSVCLSPLDISGFIHDAGQPTAHFEVLKRRGLDSRRIIVDESAPLYHIGLSERYAPQMFIASDNDMKNRYEQTLLTLSTLKHFGYDENKIRFTLMKDSTHTSYVGSVDENGNSIFGRLCEKFIRDFSKI